MSQSPPSDPPKKKVILTKLQRIIDIVEKKARPSNQCVVPKELSQHIKIEYKDAGPALSITNLIIGGEENSIERNDIVLPQGIRFVTLDAVTTKFDLLDGEKGVLVFDATACLSFDMRGCNFSDINVQIIVPHQIKFLQQADSPNPNANLHIQDSKFKSLVVEHKQMFKQGKKFLTRLIGNTIIQDLSIKTSKEVDTEGLLYIIKNDIEGTFKLDVHSKNIRMSLAGGNKIRGVDVTGLYPHILYWGQRESIGENIKYNNKKQERAARKIIALNKDVFINFRKMIIEKGDKLQENALIYHIAKSDELLLKAETGFRQEKIIMFLGRVLSRHGTSWSRPLLCIVGGNLLIGAIISCILFLLNPGIFNYLDFINTFFALFNPLSTPASIVNGIDDNMMHEALQLSVVSISLFVFAAKGFYAMCIYEFVRAARRFTIK